MHYTREQHKKFLDKELQAISENYIRVLNTKATALLSENEIYVSQFMKVDLEKDAEKEDVYKGSGQVILKFKKDKGIPRQNEYFTALIFANKTNLRPLSIGLFSMIQSMKYTNDFSGMFATVIIVLVPTIVIYIILSKKIISKIIAYSK